MGEEPLNICNGVISSRATKIHISLCSRYEREGVISSSYYHPRKCVLTSPHYAGAAHV